MSNCEEHEAKLEESALLCPNCGEPIKATNKKRYNLDAILLATYFVSLFVVLAAATNGLFFGPFHIMTTYSNMNDSFLCTVIIVIILTSLILYANQRRDIRNSSIAFIILGVFVFFCFCASANSLRIWQNHVEIERGTSYDVAPTGVGTPYYNELVKIRNNTIIRMLGYLFASFSMIAYGVRKYLWRKNKKIKDIDIMKIVDNKEN